MPFVLPRSFPLSQTSALVLAFGKLSILEACSKLTGAIERAESPCERVAVLNQRVAGVQSLTELAGIHKCGPLLGVIGGDDPDVSELVGTLGAQFDRIRNLSLSGYDVGEDEYESIVRSLLDGLRDSGFSKVRLLRPKQNELLADQVASREALDIIVFPYHGGFAIAPTAWVPDSAPIRARGVDKPSPHSDISMSPRLAKLCLNIAGLTPGQVVVDPFCGSGTVLAEALVAGLGCIGFDKNEGRVSDARKNLTWLTGGVATAPYEVRKGDARQLSRLLDRGKVDAVVTEPMLLPRLQARPRTQTAEEMLAEKEGIYADALASMADVLAPGGRVVIVVPVVKTNEGEEVTIRLDGRKLGLKDHQPGPVGFEYPVRPSFESTRWVGRAVYVFESPD